MSLNVVDNLYLELKPLGVLCHTLSCLYVSACHNPTQNVTMATAVAWGQATWSVLCVTNTSLFPNSSPAAIFCVVTVSSRD